MNDLTSQLYVGKVDDLDLARVILGFFGHASQKSDDVVECGRDGEPCALMLVYDEKRLQSILPGPGLKSADVTQLVEQVQSDLLGPSKLLVGRDILFSSYPVTAYFEARDFFQIVPVPRDAPKPTFGFGKHPFVIEFIFCDSPNTWIGGSRRLREAYRLALFLSAVLEGTISYRGIRGRHHWVIVPPVTAQPPKYDYCQEGYWFDGLKVVDETFSALERWEPIKQVETGMYYWDRPIEGGRSLQLPTSIGQLVDCYRALSTDARDQFLRAAFWQRHATEARSYSTSASYLALINSVEALIPPERGMSRCKACGRETGRSITQRFVEFLEDIVPSTAGDESVSRVREKIYRLRGKLGHGGALLGDDLAPQTGAFDPSLTSEWDDVRQASALARLALVNWLSRQGATA